MKFYSILLALLSLLAFPLQGQNVRVSPELSLRSDDDFDIIGEIEDRYYLLIDRSGRIQFEVYREDLSRARSIEVQLEDKTVDYIGSVRDDSSFHIVYAIRDRGSWVIRAREYATDLNLIDSSTVFRYDKSVIIPYFGWDLSDDNSQALIFYTENDRRLDALVYNVDKREFSWRNTFEFEDGFRDSYVQALVSNRGDLYLVAESNNRKIGRNEYGFRVLKYSALKGEPFVFEYKIEELIHYDYTMAFDNLNERLVIAGLYSEKNNSRANGVYQLAISAFNLEDFNFAFHPFEPQVYRDLYGEEGRKKKGIMDISPKDIILRQDGGALFICEIERMFERRPTYTAQPYANVRTSGRGRWVDFYNEDLVIYSIHPNGQLHWFRVLPKKQFSQDDEGVFSSYFLFESPSHVRLIFNDEIRNNNTVSEYILTPGGQNDRNAVMSTDYQKLRLRFRDAVQTSGSEVIVPSDRNSRFNLVRLRY